MLLGIIWSRRSTGRDSTRPRSQRMTQRESLGPRHVVSWYVFHLFSFHYFITNYIFRLGYCLIYNYGLRRHHPNVTTDVTKDGTTTGDDDTTDSSTDVTMDSTTTGDDDTTDSSTDVTMDGTTTGDDDTTDSSTDVTMDSTTTSDEATRPVSQWMTQRTARRVTRVQDTYVFDLFPFHFLLLTTFLGSVWFTMMDDEATAPTCDGLHNRWLSDTDVEVEYISCRVHSRYCTLGVHDWSQLVKTSWDQVRFETDWNRSENRKGPDWTGLVRSGLRSGNF
jgi:hypothetical protein